MCPAAWQRDTVCRVNIRVLTPAPNRSERLKSPVFQRRTPAEVLVAPSLLQLANQGRPEEEQ
jgi:hypothetical protein